MPAIGFPMLLSMMIKKDMWIFLLLGFVFASYLNVPTLGVAIIAAAGAGIYDIIIEGQKRHMVVEAVSDEGTDEEGEYDL